MKGLLKTGIVAVGLLFTSASLLAQKKVEVEAQVDLVSKYMWRGLELGDISLQPQVEMSWQGLYLGAYANKGFSMLDEEEFDLSLGYRAPFGINLGVIDYWQTGVVTNDIYFQYDKGNTAHQLEGNVGFECKYFSLQGYCYFYGNDYKLDGTQAYSTYIELTVPFRLSGLDWTAKAGMTPMESAGTKTVVNTYGYHINYTYADGPACVLASLRACKELDLRGAKMPIYVELHANPYLQKLHLLGGVAIKIGKK